eukprot:COSAG01_NODE_2640_length_7295_cov_4.485955_4_plen_232_part_00
MWLCGTCIFRDCCVCAVRTVHIPAMLQIDLLCLVGVILCYHMHLFFTRSRCCGVRSAFLGRRAWDSSSGSRGAWCTPCPRASLSPRKRWKVDARDAGGQGRPSRPRRERAPPAAAPAEPSSRVGLPQAARGHAAPLATGRAVAGRRRRRWCEGGQSHRLRVPCRAVPFPPSIFLDKNRRDIGKYQSKRGPCRRWRQRAHPLESRTPTRATIVRTAAISAACAAEARSSGVA